MAERYTQRRFSRTHNLLFMTSVLLVVSAGEARWLLSPTDPGNGLSASAQTKKLYRIEIEDLDEAGLIQQVLKINPFLLQGRNLYYYAGGGSNRASNIRKA